MKVRDKTVYEACSLTYAPPDRIAPCIEVSNTIASLQALKFTVPYKLDTPHFQPFLIELLCRITSIRSGIIEVVHGIDTDLFCLSV